MEPKQRITIINVISIIMLVICLALCGGLIIISTSKSSIEILEKSVEELQKNYTSTEDTTATNTWDISATENDNVTATLSDYGILTISGTGNMKDWNYNSTTEWHGMRNKVRSVIIEEGVKRIGNYAFYNCNSTSLTNIKIPSSVTKIGHFAFAGCESLISIEIPESVTSIGYRTFSTCKKLTSIKIPQSITSMGNEVFKYCESLANIEVDENNTVYKDYNGVLYSKDGTHIIKYPEGKLGNEYAILSGTINVENYAFEYCESLTSIKIPESVATIGNYAFYYCTSLISIGIPQGVTNIGWQTFEYCESLTNIKVDENNTIYKDDNGVLYTKDGTKIIKYPEGNLRTEYTILSGTINMEGEAFYNCKNLMSLEIPESVMNIENRAFRYCTSLINIEVEEKNATYKDDNGVLYTKDGLKIIKYPKGKREKEYAILEGVTSIGEDAFEECISLTSIEIPSSVTSIGGGAFSGCESLTSIEIPSSVTSIGGGAFYHCQITKLIDANNNVELPDILKRTQDENDLLYSSGGLKFTNCIIEDNIIQITDINEPAKLEVINGSMKDLTYIILVNTWDASATENDNVKVTLSDDWTLTISGTGNMGGIWSTNAVWHEIHDKVKTVIIENGVRNIVEFAFVYCSSLTNIEIQESVTSMGDHAFSGCESLIDIEVNENNTVYKDDNGVLYTKDGTQIIKYPAGKDETQYSLLEGVTSIGDAAFIECIRLISIEIPESVINIEEEAFNWCDNLTIICSKGSTAESYVKENENNYIIMSKINPKTTIEEMRTNIESNIEYEIVNKNNEETLVTSYTATGYKIKANGNDVHTLIVTGDCTGDGKSDIQDIFAINKHRLNNGKLTNEYLLAGDANRDGKTNVNDIFLINKYRLGIIEIL